MVHDQSDTYIRYGTCLVFTILDLKCLRYGLGSGMTSNVSRSFSPWSSIHPSIHPYIKYIYWYSSILERARLSWSPASAARVARTGELLATAGAVPAMACL